MQNNDLKNTISQLIFVPGGRITDFQKNDPSCIRTLWPCGTRNWSKKNGKFENYKWAFSIGIIVSCHGTIDERPATYEWIRCSLFRSGGRNKSLLASWEFTKKKFIMINIFFNSQSSLSGIRLDVLFGDFIWPQSVSCANTLSADGFNLKAVASVG